MCAVGRGRGRAGLASHGGVSPAGAWLCPSVCETHDTSVTRGVSARSATSPRGCAATGHLLLPGSATGCQPWQGRGCHVPGVTPAWPCCGLSRGSHRGTGHPFTPSILAYFSAKSQPRCHIPLPPFPPLSQAFGSRWSEFLGVWAGLTFLSSSLCPNLQKIVAFFFSLFPLPLPFPLFPRELGTPERLGGPGGAVSFVPSAVWLLWGWRVWDVRLSSPPPRGLPSVAGARISRGLRGGSGGDPAGSTLGHGGDRQSPQSPRPARRPPQPPDGQMDTAAPARAARPAPAVPRAS